MKSNIALALGIFLLSYAFTNAQTIRKPGDFDALQITGNLEVVLIHGTENIVEIEEDGSDEVRLEWQGDVLRIKRPKLYDWTKYGDDSSIRLRVTYTQLSALKASAGAQLITSDTITTDDLHLRFGSGATGKLSIQTENVKVQVLEGAKLHLRGRTERQEVNVATGGMYHAYQFDAERSYIKASTGSLAEVVALEKLDATAHTGGEIQYKGNPERLRVSDKLGGEVRDH